MKSNLVNINISVDTKEYLEKLAIVTYLLKQLNTAVNDLNGTEITVSAKTKENTTTANSDVESKLNKLTSKVQEHDARIESIKDFMQSSMSEVLQKVSEIGNIVGLK